MKKLLLTIVQVKALPTTNEYDTAELQPLAESSLALGGFIHPPVIRRSAEGYEVISGHREVAAAHLARTINPRGGEAIPVMLIEEEMEEAAAVQLEAPAAPVEAPKAVLTPVPNESTPLPEIKRYCQERGITPMGDKRIKANWMAAVREFYGRDAVITTK